MKKGGIGAVLAVIATVMLAAGADRNPEAQRLLKAAMNTELVDGNVKAAIDQYKRIVDEYDRKDRATTAQALLRLAEAYQKLGDAESRKTYERIVREYGDQSQAAALARARLSDQRAPTARGDRPVWTGPNVDLFGQVSPDGRFITYVDWVNTGNVAVHDTLSNTDRAITKKTSWKESEIGEGGWSTVSRDGKQVAYAWTEWDRPQAGTSQNNRKTIQIAALEGGRLQSRQLFLAPGDIDFVSPYDWSPDGKWLAVLLENRKEGAFQIGTVAVSDGSFRRLKSVAWPAPTKLFFSGDSKYIAYDQPGDDSDQRDIFLLAIDGSHETPLVVHPSNDKPLGFSPDGTRLLFASDRTGAAGLWAAPIVGGKPAGAPELLKADIGSASSIRSA